MRPFNEYLSEKRRKAVKTKSLAKLNKELGKITGKRKNKMQMVRGMNRKSLRQVPLSQQTNSPWGTSGGSAETMVDVAKATTRGLWKLTKREVIDVATKYKFNVPNAEEKTKHLGSTGIIMWRRKPGMYYLVKRPRTKAAFSDGKR
jgi:activator of HSP90 ATPase